MRSETSTEGFHPSHFFVLLSLLAATVAVVVARPSAPESFGSGLHGNAKNRSLRLAALAASRR